MKNCSLFSSNLQRTSQANVSLPVKYAALEFAVAALCGSLQSRHMSSSISSEWCRQKLPGALVGLVLLLLVVGSALGHQVPSLTVEALFSADRNYTLRVSLDPRLFLSDQPSSLPPVPIEWYRDQTEKDLEATRKKAAEYLQRALMLKFGDKPVAVENCDYQPMDGATNMPLAADTKEVHLLATMKGRVPEGEKSFAVALSQSANVSMILMNSFEGLMERRPNVIFPGETTRPYQLAFKDEPTAALPSQPTTPSTDKEQKVSQPSSATPESRSSLPVAGVIAAAIACAVAIVALVRRGKR